MDILLTRFLIHLLTPLLALIPASWAVSYGLWFDGTTLHADLTVALSMGFSAALTGLGLSTLIFSVWGTGGLSGFVRTVIYSLSPTIATAMATVAGLGVGYDNGVVSLHIPTLAGFVIAGGGISAGILNRWGVK